MLRIVLLVAAAVATPAAFGAEAPHGGPVIDMHVHAFTMAEVPPGAPACPGDQAVVMPTVDPAQDLDFSAMGACARPLLAPPDDAGLRDGTITALRRHDVRRAMLEGPVERVAEWREAAPGLFLPGVAFGARKEPSIDELRRLHAAGRLAVLGEAYIQYRGQRPDDPRYDPYFSLAEELDIPVAIHMGEGPPATARFPGYEDYRAAMGSPFLLEAVLRKHPKLRIYVMHYGSPLVDEMIAMMFAYPNLYVDVACNDWAMPRAQFHDALRRMVDAGFAKRILFGTDQMYWPDAVGEAIESIEAAPFLDAGQKRDILYGNAARFLRLSEAEIAADHAPARR
ncbi:amidohydrolase family protein [Luteimonas sp. 50]|uniref:Amidohydrolase family protein n=1 Tax=Cognatiluteimonas sedimenti TaxID=2927791 RepID=A0ABT0A6F0_9GAMM|nr:amidohydrolase family protein [Lysobacter sedimenti]MCJ0826562.1 amidohydrolase family protein [Lysobacter sedimenti]